MDRIKIELPPIPDRIVLLYKSNGLKARELCGLEDKDLDNNLYEIIIPDKIINMTSSFIDGLFDGSVKNIDSIDKFSEKYYIKYDDFHIIEEVTSLYTEKFYDSINIKNKVAAPDNNMKADGLVITSTFIGVVLLISTVVGFAVSIKDINPVLCILQAPQGFLGIMILLEHMIDKRSHNRRLKK